MYTMEKWHIISGDNEFMGKMLPLYFVRLQSLDQTCKVMLSNIFRWKYSHTSKLILYSQFHTRHFKLCSQALINPHLVNYTFLSKLKINQRFTSAQVYHSSDISIVTCYRVYFVIAVVSKIAVFLLWMGSCKLDFSGRMAKFPITAYTFKNKVFFKAGFVNCIVYLLIIKTLPLGQH